MKRTLVAMCGFGLVLALTSEGLSNNRTDDPLGIAVSPQTLILDSDQGGRVTVHTAIPASQVDRSSVALNGIPASSTGVDLRGNLVANFLEADIKAIVEPPETTLTLTGDRLDGTSFAGSDTVRVIGEPDVSGIVVPTLSVALGLLGMFALAARRR